MDPVDRLILDESPEPDGPVLVVDAPELATAASARGWAVWGYADSLLLEQRFDVPMIDRWPGDADGGAPDADIELILLRLPKAVAALEEYAQRFALLPRDVRLVAGGRVKHMTHAMNEALATRFGTVRASLGRQKSRVLHAADPIPGPLDFPRTAQHPELDLTLAAHGATFAGTRIDPGTRLLTTVLDRLPASDPHTPAVDLGSGNGTLSVLLARAGHRVLALDESRAACASTAASARLNGVEVDVERADGLTGRPDGSSGLIVCNPPFHVGTAKDSTPALAMIDDAARVLRPGGELWLVFNAHLPYLPRLRQRIGRTEIVARNPKFIVSRSVRGARLA
ncbi:class I SAM-dependent methyltransferase [Granulicoccus sp. GXG6511]|uniref:class I SAM-dependent methyltransferase n=1 Tax=Granulicoccus sp. GXG6511 TaxID=3381351 RepID=UPI003D7C8D07